MQGKPPRSLFVCILVCILLFASACGSDEIIESEGPQFEELLQQSQGSANDEEQIVLRLWSFHLGEEYDFWQWLSEQYEKEHPNVEIKVEYVSSDVYFSGTRLLSSFVSGRGPDIFFVSPGTINRFVDADILKPLKGYFTPEMLADFYPSALEAVTVNNEIFAVPIETEVLGLYYNKDMFKRHNIKPPQTWDEMMYAARRLATPEVAGLTMETFNNVYQTFTWLPFLWQTGSDLVDSISKKSALDHPGTVQMYSFFRQMVDEKLLNMNPSRPTQDIGILANGETAMQVSGSWNIRKLETDYKDRNIGVVPLPVMASGDPALTIAGGWKIAANQFNEHAEEAVKFILWAFGENTEYPLKWCTEVKFAYSPRISVMEQGSDRYHGGLRGVFTDEIIGTERQEPQNATEINNIFNATLQELLYSRTDPLPAVRNAKEQIDEYLSIIKK